MNDDVMSIGNVNCPNSATKIVRIVHISDTHHAHNTLTPLRPLSGNIAILRSTSIDSPNQIIDETGADAFARSASARLQMQASESNDSSFHKGGTFLSSFRRSHSSSTSVPPGDVLIHSGDFAWNSKAPGLFRSENFEEIIQAMNDFFDRFPHKVKIFVAGNHEASLEGKKLLSVQERLTSAVYLYNSSYTYEGIHFYGAPYTPFRLTTNATGFQRHSRSIAAHWREIPSRTDVLITHTPPHGILDLATDFTARKVPKLSSAIHRLLPKGPCSTCGIIHPGRSHWGCRHLREEVLIRIKPKLHLFGHVHECNGITTKNGVTFSNAAYKLSKQHHVFDYYVS
ncbi:UPF0046 protein K07C11.7 isoform X2 [Aplysia californica]|nr:UPF0046 protein K07C11.7 isoform X2 [Aplysia californica]